MEMKPHHALYAVPIGALLAGLVTGIIETWLHISHVPATSDHWANLVIVASLVNHVLALFLGIVVWVSFSRMRKVRMKTRIAMVVAAQSVGLVAAGILYWYNDVKLAAPLLAPPSLKADAIITLAALIVWALATLLLRRLGIARLAHPTALAPYTVGVVLLSISTQVVTTPPMTSLRSRSGAEPNVILVSVDTQRADRLSTYGHHRITSPRIDEVAADGLTFARAYSPAPSSAPGHAAMLTGLHPISSGVHVNGQRLPDGVVTLAEHMSEAGYRTGAFVQNPWLTTALGFSQGFQTYFNDRRLEQASDLWLRLLLHNTLVFRIRDRIDRSFDTVTPPWLPIGSEAESLFPSSITSSTPTSLTTPPTTERTVSPMSHTTDRPRTPRPPHTAIRMTPVPSMTPTSATSPIATTSRSIRRMQRSASFWIRWTTWD